MLQIVANIIFNMFSLCSSTRRAWDAYNAGDFQLSSLRVMPFVCLAMLIFGFIGAWKVSLGHRCLLSIKAFDTYNVIYFHVAQGRLYPDKCTVRADNVHLSRWRPALLLYDYECGRSL